MSGPLPVQPDLPAPTESTSQSPRDEQRGRLAAEAALAASEERFRLLAERSQDIFYRVAVPSYTVEYLSPAVTTVTGYTPEEHYADGGLWRRMVRPADERLVEVESNEASAMEKPVVMRWFARDGSVIWVEHRGVPVYGTDGSVVAVEGVARDVTRQVETEQRLRESEARFRQFLSEIDLGALMLDATGNVVFINDHLLGLLGRTREAMIGSAWTSVVPERERAALADEFGRAISDGSISGTREDSIVTLEGQERLLSWTSVVQRDTHGAVSGMASIAHDVTDVRRVEEQLRGAQRLESLGQLAGGVAHDFNNLLAAIMNYSGLAVSTLQDEMARRGGLDDTAMTTVLDDVAQIISVAKRAAALTHQLLIFGRRQVLQPQQLDLNSIIVDMEELLLISLGQGADHLRTILAPDLPMITIDRGQLEQVIMNLAVNARDAMAPGGELSIETGLFDADDQYSGMHELTPGAYVQLSVSDTGTGMLPDVAARAFEPFFTTKQAAEGSGLGLATVFGIVTQAGGDVSIYTEPDLGTTVRVYLPATVAAQTPARADDTDPPLVAHGETVLLVEDEEMVREPVRRMLVRNGYTVLTAGGAGEAMDIVSEYAGTIELLLTDVVMPGRSGRELSLDVVAQRPATKLLFMSGYSENVIVHDGVLDAGVNLIEKPFSADDLLRWVRSILDDGVAPPISRLERHEL